jgi:hypothetical protein
MAEVNGVSKHEDPVTVSVSHLGKRKRTVSPQVEEIKDAALQPTLQRVLQLLRKCVPNGAPDCRCPANVK